MGDLTTAGHWESRLRKREFDSIVGRLRSHGRRCGAIISDDRATDAAEACFSLADELEARQECFENLKFEFVKLAEVEVVHPHG